MDDNTRAVLVIFITSLTTLGVAWIKARETRKFLENQSRDQAEAARLLEDE